MTLSFITATYNLVAAGRGEMLGRCVESVAKIHDCEHIIVDGASNDGTIELLQDLECRAGLVIKSEPDRGIYDALNKGIELAKGDWIHIIGCDDYIYNSEALEQVLRYAKDTDAEIVVTPVEKSSGGRSINLKACLYSIPYCHQGVLMRKSLIERVGGFDPALKLAGDYDLTLKAHLGGAKEVVLPHKFAFYSTGGASSDWGKLRAESTKVAARRFGLTESEERYFDKTRCLPFRIIIPLLFHRRKIVRVGAAFSIVRRLAFSFRRSNESR